MKHEQLEFFTVKNLPELSDYRVCSKCKEKKHIQNYSLQMGGKARRTECKECAYKNAVLREQLMKENPKPTDVDYMCPICKNTEEQLKFNGQFHDRSVWVLDHNHSNGTFRSWICNNCNMGLGKFNDNEETVKEALKYLKKHKGLLK